MLWYEVLISIALLSSSCVLVPVHTRGNAHAWEGGQGARRRVYTACSPRSQANRERVRQSFTPNVNLPHGLAMRPSKRLRRGRGRGPQAPAHVGISVYAECVSQIGIIYKV